MEVGELTINGGGGVGGGGIRKIKILPTSSKCIEVQKLIFKT